MTSYAATILNTDTGRWIDIPSNNLAAAKLAAPWEVDWGRRGETLALAVKEDVGSYRIVATRTVGPKHKWVDVEGAA